ncbi:FHY3/FAR1 family [Parasponia andersonii]|uniref:Protein FAR1-RELATED SEQUENCE n=1 Tax=Parasponia andersonii TaxID=3476 RepID=A0A2P5CBG7_PARAD|nr:FHY3/FAR1 family [Parasponia andersonii]
MREDSVCEELEPVAVLRRGVAGLEGVFYTRTILEKFKDELLDSFDWKITREIRGTSKTTTSTVLLVSGSSGAAVAAVTFDRRKEEFSCMCAKFESMGILCSHALKIFNASGVYTIPRQYVSRRWKKSAKDRLEIDGYEHREEIMTRKRKGGSRKFDFAISEEVEDFRKTKDMDQKSITTSSSDANNNNTISNMMLMAAHILIMNLEGKSRR